MKKVFALALSLLLMLSVGVTAFADPDTDSAYDATQPAGFSISIANAIVGETYNAYKIFDVTYANDDTSATSATHTDGSDAMSAHQSYTYSITNDSPWWSVVTNEANPSLNTNPAEFSANGLKFTKTAGKVGDATIYTVEEGTGFSAAAFAAYLSTHIPTDVTTGDPIEPSGSATLQGDGTQSETGIKRGTATIRVGGAGYYFVTTTTGALCSLDTTEPVANIVEKNDIPDVNKYVSDTSDGTWSDKTDVDIGDTVYYKIEVSTGVGNNAAITLHDTMDSSLTLNRKDDEGVDTTFVVMANDAVVAPTDGTEANYTVTYGKADGCTFEIVFSEKFITGLGDHETIFVYFDATLNEGAKIFGQSNDNKTHIQYSNQTSQEHIVKVYTYDFYIVKIDTDVNLLPGAEFTLSSGGNAIEFIKSGNNYRVAKSGETGANPTLTSSDEKLHITGLDAGTYTLTETKAPSGYNMAREPITIIIKGVTNVAADAGKQGNIYSDADCTLQWKTSEYKEEGEVLDNTIEVINRTGSELPSTGGIGTTIFYIVGGILIIGAAVILIARRKSRKEA